MIKSEKQTKVKLFTTLHHEFCQCIKQEATPLTKQPRKRVLFHSIVLAYKHAEFSYGMVNWQVCEAEKKDCHILKRISDGLHTERQNWDTSRKKDMPEGCFTTECHVSSLLHLNKRQIKWYSIISLSINLKRQAIGSIHQHAQWTEGQKNLGPVASWINSEWFASIPKKSTFNPVPLSIHVWKLCRKHLHFL